MAAVNWGMLAAQFALAIGVLYYLSIAHNGPNGKSPIFPLLPGLGEGASSFSVSKLLVWLAGLCVLVPSLIWLPRIVLTFLASMITVLADWALHGMDDALADVHRRKVYAAAGAAVGCLTSIVVFYAPVDVIRPEIGTLMPALHNNFWLTVHVLPITASYGAGALAWGLGNLALAHYLFGRYRQPRAAGNTSKRSLRQRPPEVCATLAGYTYKAILVAVLLLIAGTILGALWADFAWGRFWGWDAKEVWSLISILVYMVILHGRYVGWAGNFGLAAGSVMGLTSILMAWYGVNNFLPDGLHSYGGGGSGGHWPVLLVTLCNWLFVLAAAVRYRLEIHSAVTPLPTLPADA